MDQMMHPFSASGRTAPYIFRKCHGPWQQKKNKHEIDFYFESDGEEVTIDIEDETANVDDVVIKNEDCRKVREVLLKLSLELQDAVNLVYNCNFSCAEAAKFLGISDSALRNRLYQARKKLKEALTWKRNLTKKKKGATIKPMAKWAKSTKKVQLTRRLSSNNVYKIIGQGYTKFAELL